jgi:hypothetical protein
VIRLIKKIDTYCLFYFKILNKGKRVSFLFFAFIHIFFNKLISKIKKKFIYFT